MSRPGSGQGLCAKITWVTQQASEGAQLGWVDAPYSPFLNLSFLFWTVENSWRAGIRLEQETAPSLPRNQP